MSAVVWGAIEAKNNNISIQELINLASDITIAAARNKLGFDIGHRVQPWIYDRFKKSYKIKDTIQFSMSDNPLDPNMDSLIIPEMWETGPANEILGIDIDNTGETLDSRMPRVQSFLEEVLKITNVNKITLHIESGWGGETIIQINAKDFKKELLPLYENRRFAPSVIFTIFKEKAE